MGRWPRSWSPACARCQSGFRSWAMRTGDPSSSRPCGPRSGSRDACRGPALQRAAGASDLAVPPPAAVGDCAAKLGPKRRFFTTADVVADLDMLRAALGADRWTLDGVSYGTFVAEHYALAHPEHVRRLVLDSVVPQEGIDPFQLETIHAVPRVLRAACAERHC